MFLSDSHHPVVLQPADYHSAAQLELEQQNLFASAWHWIGLSRQLQNDNAYFTTTVLGRPLIVWRTQRELHCFLNVCAHRFSMLTSQPCGHTDRLRCQYHGWEYDHTGQTRKIPDATSFKPLGADQLGLTKFELRNSGNCLFARLQSQPSIESQDLPNQLGPVHDILNEHFSGDSSHIATVEWNINCNWKLVIENAIESYHVEFVHGRSFGSMPPENSCEHEFGECWSRFTTVAPSQAPRLVQLAEHAIHRAVGLPYVEDYSHYHAYPNTMFSFNKMFATVIVAEPISVATTRLRLTLLTRSDLRKNLASRMAMAFANRFAIRQAKSVIEEDIGVLEDTQRGLQSSQLPHGGLLSIREERIAHFQAYIASIKRAQ